MKCSLSVSECIIVISLYLRDYINKEQFEDIYFSNLGVFEIALRNDIFFSILDTNFSHKDERVKLDSKLTAYLLECYHISLKDINDLYVENIIENGNNPMLCDLLNKKYIQKDEVTIDCSNIFSHNELIEIIKSKLEFPEICSNWDGINDMLYDVLFPKKIIIINWDLLKTRLHDDAIIFEELLRKKIMISNYSLIVEYH